MPPHDLRGVTSIFTLVPDLENLPGILLNSKSTSTSQETLPDAESSKAN